MKNFEERKMEYFQKLKKYSEFILDLTKEQTNEMIVEVLLNPKNEKELEFGNYYLMFIEETKQLIANLSNNNIDEIIPEESVYVEYLSGIINALYNNVDEIKKINETYMENNGELLAKVLYEMIVITITNPEGLCESICKRCNFDIEDEFQVMQFQFLMNKANKQLKPQMIPENEEEINKFIAFVNHYQKCCIGGIKDYLISERSENVGEDDMIQQEQKQAVLKKSNSTKGK